MNRQEFIDTLKRCLTDEGFPTDYVETQCRILTDNINSLTEEQATQYLTEKNIDIILRKLISQDAHLLSQKVVSPAKEAAVPTSDQSTSESEEEIVVADDEQVLPLSDMMQDDLSAGPIATPRRYKRPASISSEYTPCDKPRLLTFLLLVICFPTIVLFLTTAFGLFAGVFLVLAASIFFIVLAIIGIVGVGSLVSVVSLLYGATEILSSPRYVGFHEIGFGLIVAGFTMASSILLYNLAIRWIPIITQQMGKLFKLFFMKLISFAKNAVKGCEQL